ncbi:hypothetical protein HGRIS_014455 [Hohenbuehelia grisea]|uniref:Uncharacterized protein n=1 Tax=Hohenbuehelia grisea TaxID=104357 RepID=A0ABR3JVP3_9AGAR
MESLSQDDLEGLNRYGGTLLISGACLGLPLYGLALGQGVWYYRHYAADRTRLKLLVRGYLAINAPFF